MTIITNNQVFEREEFGLGTCYILRYNHILECEEFLILDLIKSEKPNSLISLNDYYGTVNSGGE